jgi:hypothetical protein
LEQSHARRRIRRVTCRTCDDDALRLIGGECLARYQHRYRHGVGRPKAAIVKHAGGSRSATPTPRRVRRILLAYHD